MKPTITSLLVVGCIAGVAACAPPDSFEDLTGGTPPVHASGGEPRSLSTDPTLVAPRPVSPVSVSWVSSSRPRFAWQLAQGTTGAVVELCPSRACDHDTVRIEVDGNAITSTNDLTPGFWYWRLFGRNGDRIGDKPSPTWQLLVRGPAKTGSSDSPTGSIVDLDGDGQPDLIATAQGYNGALLLVYRGKPGGQFEADAAVIEESDQGALGSGPIAAGVDLDGDGFSDLVSAVRYPGSDISDVWIEYGTSDYMKVAGQPRTGGLLVPPSTSEPQLREAGDVNGDGFGDLVVASGEIALVGLGDAAGAGAILPFLAEAPPPEGRALLGAFDANADGLSDLVYARAKGAVPAEAAPGDHARLAAPTALMPGVPGAVQHAQAFASGDFNGDGIPDIAATVVIDQVPNICLWRGDRARLLVAEQDHCIPPADPKDMTFGSQITAADVDGNGKDELLVTVTDGGKLSVVSFSFDDNGFDTDEVMEQDIGKRLTTIWPGRPGKARWATTSADETAILVYEGMTLIQTLHMPTDAAQSAFGRSIR